MLAAIFLGGMVTYLLFLLMSTLIDTDEIRVSEEPPIPIDYALEKIEIDKTRKVRKLPKKVEPPKDPPPPQMQNVAQTQSETVNTIDIKLANLDMSVANIGLSVGRPGEVGTQDGDAVPLVTFPPQYPPYALKEKVVANITFQFDIKPDGYPTNIKVIKADAKKKDGSLLVRKQAMLRDFIRSASKTIKKWRFQSRVVDGQPVLQENMQYTLKFQLSD